MKKIIDSEQGRKDYARRMWTIGRLMLLHNLHFRHPWRSARVWQYQEQ